MLSIMQLPVTDTVQVFEIKGLTKQQLELYFENPRYGGGEIANLDFKEEENVALVSFCDKTGSHQLLKSDLFLRN